jgi:RND family efflux transporter MFP subunit
MFNRVNHDGQTSESPTAVAPEATPRPWRGRRVAAAVGVFVVGLAALFAVGILPKLRNQQTLDAAATAAAAAPPRVTVVAAHRGPAESERALPGSALPYLSASLYARTNGYLKRRLVDIGDRVAEGQLLAEIAAPDVDDQLAQARANLEQARANLKLTEANAELARTVLERSLASNRLAPRSVTQEEIDQNQAVVATSAATVETAKASIVSNQATVKRYADLQAFQRIVAPFAGVITARSVDPGALITADNPSTERQLFHLDATDPLRVFVDVPQVFATSVKPGMTASVFRREEPGRAFPGKVARTASALDPNTRTLRTQVDVPNPDGALLPGMYLQVKFVFPRQLNPILIPTAALATRTAGPRVAVLDGQHRAHYRPVQLGRDYGAEVEVVAGVQEGETVVVHPGDDLPDGTTVEPVAVPGAPTGK